MTEKLWIYDDVESVMFGGERKLRITSGSRIQSDSFVSKDSIAVQTEASSPYLFRIAIQREKKRGKCNIRQREPQPTQTVLASLVESKTVLFIPHFANNSESKARKLTPRCCSNRRLRARIALAIVLGQLLKASTPILVSLDDSMKRSKLSSDDEDHVFFETGFKRF